MSYLFLSCTKKIDSIDENKNNFVDVGVARKIDFNIKITRTDDEK